MIRLLVETDRAKEPRPAGCRDLSRVIVYCTIMNSMALSFFSGMIRAARQPIQRADVVVLGQRLQTEVLADEVVAGSQRQGGGELLADKGAARCRHWLDPRRTADVTAEVVLPVQNRVVALKHRPRVQADAHARLLVF